MPKEAFAHVTAWVFDLDNTLYDPSHRLFDQIDRRMTDFIANALDVALDEANALRARYWREYGTTLAGLMEAHGMSPDAYLDYVHDIDLDHMPPTPELGDAVAALPGRKIVHTNGSRGHAARVLARLDIADAFDAVYGIEDSGYAPKPARIAYERVLSAAEIDPRTAAMFEDSARNLEAPRQMGMRTVWRPTRASDQRTEIEALDAESSEHADFVVEDLAAFLKRLI